MTWSHWREIGGHSIETSTKRGYQHSTHVYRCSNDGCYIEVQGEHNVREYIEEMAHEHDCPSGTDTCPVCGHDMRPGGEICKTCAAGVETSPRVYQ